MTAANKVEIVLFGKRALVDADQVKMLQKKESLVIKATDLQSANGSVEELQKIVRSIRGLNGKIRQNVVFL